MRFYVASKFENRVAVREAIEKLNLAGHSVTHDWTIMPAFNQQEAHRCKDGVIEAEFVVALFELPYLYKGSLVEIGVAIASDIPVFILGDKFDDVIFSHLPGVMKMFSIEDIIEYLAYPRNTWSNYAKKLQQPED